MTETDIETLDEKLDMITKLLLDHVRQKGNSPANRHKGF